MSQVDTSQEINSLRDQPSYHATEEGPVQGDNDVQVEPKEEHAPPSLWNKAVEFYWANEFVCLVVVVILLARAYPPLGADYLQPQITSTWIAVVFIFGK